MHASRTMSVRDLPPSRLWPARSLAARFGVEQAWLIEEADAGRLPGVRAGRTFLFDPEVVERELLRRARSVEPQEKERS